MPGGAEAVGAEAEAEAEARPAARWSGARLRRDCRPLRPPRRASAAWFGWGGLRSGRGGTGPAALENGGGGVSAHELGIASWCTAMHTNKYFLYCNRPRDTCRVLKSSLFQTYLSGRTWRGRSNDVTRPVPQIYHYTFCFSYSRGGATYMTQIYRYTFCFSYSTIVGLLVREHEYYEPYYRGMIVKYAYS